MTNFILGLFTAWFGKKAVAFIDWTFGAIWAWYRATPRIRCYAVTVAYIGWIERMTKAIRDGKIDDPNSIRLLGRFHRWNMARLKRWQDRVWAPRISNA